METRILFFGPLKDAAGGAERRLAIPVDVTTIEGVIALIAEGDPHLAETLRGAHVRVAIDQEIVARGAPVDAPAEIAFMAPFSGG